MLNYDYVPPVVESVVERARREREQREVQRRRVAAALTLQRLHRGRRAVAAHCSIERTTFDERIRIVLPDGDALKATRAGAPLDDPPPATMLLALTRSLNFFFQPDDLGDGPRLLTLCGLLAGSVGVSTPAANFCAMSIPTPKDTLALQWFLQISRLLLRACCYLGGLSQRAIDDDSRRKARTDAAVLLRLMMCLTDERQWAYIRNRPKPHAPEMEALLAVILESARGTCRELLRKIEGALYSALAHYIAACLMPQSPLATKPDVVACAVATLAVRPILGADATGSCPASCPSADQSATSSSSSSSASLPSTTVASGTLDLFSSDFLAIPALGLRLDPTALQVLQQRGLWSRILPHLVQVRLVTLGQRYLLGNVVQLAWAAVEPVWDASDTQDRALCSAWVECVTGLLRALSPLATSRTHSDTEKLVEIQVKVLWSSDTVRRLLGDVFTPHETRVADSGGPRSSIPERSGNTASVNDWKGVLKGKGPKWANPFKKKDPLAIVAALSSKRLIAPNKNSALAPPEWLPACALYVELAAHWPSHAALASLCFRRPYLVVALWDWVETQDALQDFAEGDERSRATFLPTLTLFCQLYNNFLLITDGQEFYEAQNPFPLPTVVRIAGLLNRLAFRLLATADSNRHTTPQEVCRLRDLVCAVVAKLTDRSTRRPFAPADVWLLTTTPLWMKYLPKIKLDDPAALASLLDTPSDFTHVVSRLPHAVPFATRVAIFREKVESERRLYHVEDKKWQITVRRNKLIDDGFKAFSAVPAGGDFRLKAKLFVVFLNEHGLPEAGIDAGGVFKEFVTHSLKQVFDPAFGLFIATADDHVYPNPASGSAHPNHLALFQFVGRIAAKALFEGIVANAPLADFFLNFLLQKPNSVDDLQSQDPELFKSLMYLKSPDCNLADMCLTFSLQEDGPGGKPIKWDLLPGGAEADVTEDNLVLYIHAMADYKLNQRIAPQTRAFLTGYHEVIKADWLRMFDRRELSNLIAGESRDFSVAELRAHTQYAGGYDSKHRVIKMFWAVLGELTAPQRSRFLQFVTSCPKPPLMGFAHLHPPLCIRCAEEGDPLGGPLRALGLKDLDRLPSASTCFNLLKLPPYRTQRQLRAKLLYAIDAASGFELS